VSRVVERTRTGGRELDGGFTVVGRAREIFRRAKVEVKVKTPDN